VRPESISEEWLSRLPGLDRLWTVTKGLPEIRIAVLDGPVAEGSVEDQSVRSGRLAPSSVAAHGTLVHSIIAGSPEAGIPGLAAGCSVLSIPIFDDTADGEQPSCTQSDLAKSIHKAIDARANIINISASQLADTLTLSTDLSTALQAALGRDTLVVAAAGNHGCDCDTIPASVAGILAVGAHDEEGAPLASSNWGPNQRAQGILAPGRAVPGSCLGGGLCRASGTSFAAATVSGVAGLLMSADVARGLAASGSRARRILLQSTDLPPSSGVEMAATYLAGRLNVARAADQLFATSAPRKSREETVDASSTHDAVNQPPPAQSPEVRKEEPNRVSENAGPVGHVGADLIPADCGCGCGGGASGECACENAEKPVQLVYAIGRLGVSFISQARRDSIWRTVNGSRQGDLKPISNDALQGLFKNQPYQAQSVIWTLSRTEVPMYAIVPSGAFAAEAYRWLVTEWEDADVEFASIPGVLAGQIALYDGLIVDAIVPDLRGMFSWQTKRYVKALRDARKRAEDGMSDAKLDREIERFFGKVYFSIRNRGLSPEERALNAAATNAFNVSPVIEQAGEEGLTLKDIAVERSPLNRPGSDYYDVLLTFFNPYEREREAPLRARFTIDVSDTVPVMIGDPVLWHEF
jgi:cyanobactin maturation PatA/PatG family protease